MSIILCFLCAVTFLVNTNICFDSFFCKLQMILLSKALHDEEAKLLNRQANLWSGRKCQKVRHFTFSHQISCWCINSKINNRLVCRKTVFECCYKIGSNNSTDQSSKLILSRSDSCKDKPKQILKCNQYRNVRFQNNHICIC